MKLANTKDSDNLDPRVVDFSDPNVRGASSSAIHAGTVEDRDDYIKWRSEGLSHQDATQKLARRIADRLQSVVEAMPRGDVRSFTLMLPGDPDGTLAKRPRYVIENSIYIYTQLSMKNGRSPEFYWAPGSSFLMLDNWTQAELDSFASFHGAAAVIPLQLSEQEADAIIELANSSTVRNTVPLPTSS